MKIKKRNGFRLVWFSLVTIFFIWQWTTYQSRNLPKNTFDDNNKVTVEELNDEIIFLSANPIYQNEIIFFQGGLTDPKAYAPLCRKMAENGFTCHLIKMDWRMPQWDYKKIETLFDLKNGKYIIGGHSQGAKMAAQFVYENPGLMKGLFLLGTSHPRDIDLSGRSIPTIKLYGELDGLASVFEVMENKNKLPEHTDLIEIKGGNHSQFGYLGKLLTDNNAEIDLAEQQRLTFDELIDFFHKTASKE
ncbi:alpha/beta hydrolase [Sinomicrobium pectinilyticum]|uniref:Alpha/beta hydrolase n=1 Tax=Sinomicrobium pectinilyticum TaxID=1084421 RepID=A0A3N0EJ09_SINP1|nr:alpha/beta hydrolase [Sinomicrobium pectinilyticum]RNL87772.1 alpha/beta hydrolase [Sinomicrobium pectinilyticum]